MTDLKDLHKRGWKVHFWSSRIYVICPMIYGDPNSMMPISSVSEIEKIVVKRHPTDTYYKIDLIIVNKNGLKV